MRSNKWYNSWAECSGLRAHVDPANGAFSIPNVPVENWGENILNVTVTDVSGNQSHQARPVYRPFTNALESFRYDGNGNLTNWLNGTTNPRVEWDWADRMVKLTANGTTVVQENWYDAGSHRIAKKESGVAVLYLYDGWEIVGVLNPSGAILETFTRGVGLAGDIGTLVAVTRHATAQSPGLYYLQNNHRGDVTHVRNGTTTATTYRYSAFGQLLATAGSDLCRFKFSSKERDASTGLSYYGYRFYAPQWQRWVARDPLGEFDGPHLYRFVGNNPADFIDSSGRSSTGVVVISIIGVVIIAIEVGEGVHSACHALKVADDAALARARECLRQKEHPDRPVRLDNSPFRNFCILVGWYR